MQPRNWTPRQRIEVEYRRLITSLVDSYLQFPNSATLGQINEALVNFSNIATVLKASFAIAGRMATQIKVENARSWKAAARAGSRGREIYQALEVELAGNVGERVREIVAENAQLISSIPEAIRSTVNNEISRMQEKGIRNEAIAKYLRARVPQLTRSRAALIARTETSKSATALTRARSEDLGIEWYEWATSEDARVRLSHRVMDKVLVNWNDPPSPEHLIGEPSTLGNYHAGNCPNCFPENLEVNLSNGCDKLWRRFYRGPIVSLHFSDGTFMESTPNHPVLTRSGWLSVDALKKGDYLVKAKHTDCASSQDHQSRLIKFGNLFQSLQRQICSESSPGSKFDFHGDGSENYVDVINIQSFLLDTLVASIRQGLAKFILAGAYMNFKPFSTYCARYAGCGGIRRPSSSFLRFLCQTPQFLLSQLAHANYISFASIADMHMTAQQDFSNSSTVTSEIMRELKLASTGLIPTFDQREIQFTQDRAAYISFNLESISAKSLIESIGLAWDGLRSGGKSHPIFDSLVKITSKSKRDFEGHVYNLQSITGWYGVTAENIIAHNCRCDSYPVVRLDALSWPHKVYRGGRIVRMSLAAFRQIAA